MKNPSKHPTDALNSLRSVSEAYGMEWNEDTMLAIATEFLNGLHLGDAFHQHCLNAAKASLSGTADLGVTVSDEDDEDSPGFFDVDVCRIGYGHKTLRIEADSREEAESKALDEAGNHTRRTLPTTRSKA